MPDVLEGTWEEIALHAWEAAMDELAAGVPYNGAFISSKFISR